VRGVDGWVPTSSRASGYHTTSDLPQLLDTTARVLFLDAYADTVRSFEPWTNAVTVSDFRSTIVTSAEFPSLLEVPEHAEYVAGFPFGPAVPVRLVKYGRIVQYTKEAVLRDDVATFGQLQQALGVAAASVENDVVYELLAANPVLADGAALFSATHKNLMTAAALDAASLAVACAALATNSNHGRPAVLLVGTKDGPSARRLVTEETPPDAGEASGVLQVVVDDRITGAWYVTCDPHERPTLVTAHLAAALFALGRRFSGLVAIQEGHTLVTGGLYRWIRHPSYAGALVNNLGWVLVFRSVAGVLVLLPLVGLLLVRIRAEERLLASEFGREYDAYRQRTWRLVPGVY
jgi:protein-S-isoprenylcysteine O-methyltransferase Ste14